MPRPRLVRYLGLAGSLFLAGAAWLGGASSPWEPTVTPRTILAGREGVLLPLCWLLGTALLIVAWWAGRRAVPSLRWAYVTAGLWALPLLPFLPLGSYDVYSYACQGWQQAAGLNPYAGGVDLLGCPWADAVAPTWRTSPAPYGPVFLVLAAIAAKLGGSLTGTVALLRLIAVLGVVALGWCLPRIARRAGVPPERAVWLVLACPLVPIHLVSGAHNEAVMVALMVGGLTAAVARRPLLAGVLLGLAVGVKATAVVVLPFVVLLFPGLSRKAMVAGGAAGALAAVSFGSGLGLGWVSGLAGSGVSVQWTAPPTAIGMTLELFGVPGAVAVTRILGMIALAGVLIVLWLRARTGDPLVSAGLALAATVLLAPVFHPWYALWPLAVLAATVRRDTRWLVAPPAVAAALCLPDGYNLALATKAQGAIVMTLLAGYLAWKVMHEAKSDSRRPGVDHGDADRHRRVP
ncbi:alpha-1,6-mannosyltransferase [Actinoplanes campanulatus]|uniref:Alpha-1,6-mannosyltransferase n=1 Tax=Actinoplanes campanulatus TaxID=113559 RepID=A0A7W5FIT9_9ACTN|nr:polyprenol phosphomannose-dependent alpha 1,6 mannosyltransferase MptB [Actinoplanes campanulatus]MBB3100014.1 alpha-1,6-mannosyltransferase [Actinoplanes campanulatus]GGN29412.1 membrane protein [Actinoplanes campanulatus]GID38881.1 membrane protein [Actinoplanes campanulatus]